MTQKPETTRSQLQLHLMHQTELKLLLSLLVYAFIQNISSKILPKLSTDHGFKLVINVVFQISLAEEITIQQSTKLITRTKRQSVSNKHVTELKYTYHCVN